ncbi:MAG: hypothetical protein ACOC0D_03930 [Spirochaeta sp.]
MIPLSFGVSGRGNVALYSGYWSAGGIFANAGAYGTIHLGFRDFDLEIEELKNIDIYTGIGIVFDILRPAYADYSLFHFASYQGINYFINDNLAVFLESNYMGRYSYFGTIGVLLK